ncbi:MAG: phosphatase PAP2 family protein [Bdellovibrionota bacterium]
MRPLVNIFFIFIIFSSQCFSKELTPLEHGKKTTQGAFDSTGLWILGVGTAATALSFQYDQQTKDEWKDNQKMPRTTSEYGDFWGSGIPQALIIAGQIHYDKENGIAALEGLVVGSLITHTAKIAIARERPNSTTKTSMPSGHTQAAFSIAASMTESYGWKVGLPFWGMGVFTGLTRLADNAHWLSDVVAGATIGTLFGRAGYSHHLVQPTVLFNNGHVDGAFVALKYAW